MISSGGQGEMFLVTLLGIPTGTLLGAGIITGVQLSIKSSLSAAEQNKFKLKCERTESKRNLGVFFKDILMDDGGQLSVVRLQQLVFTIAFIVIFITQFILQNMQRYPDFDNTAFVLMGISGVTYLIGKGTRK